jgi:hypothetical protein
VDRLQTALEIDSRAANRSFHGHYPLDNLARPITTKTSDIIEKVESGGWANESTCKCQHEGQKMFVLVGLVANALMPLNTSGGSPSHLFDVFGIQDTRPISITFNNAGYHVVLIENNTTTLFTLTTNQGISSNGLTFYSSLEHIDPYSVLLTIHVDSFVDVTRTISIQIGADVSLGGHLCPMVNQLSGSHGFTITSQDQITYTIVARNHRFGFDIDTYWFGYYASR